MADARMLIGTFGVGTSVPLRRSKRSLQQLAGTPWLIPKSYPRTLTVCLSIWAVLVALSYAAPILLITLGIIGGMGLLMVACWAMIRSQIQICPRCGDSMNRGFTYCSACGFHETGEGAL
jgi:hypothetical protein